MSITEEIRLAVKSVYKARSEIRDVEAFLENVPSRIKEADAEGRSSIQVTHLEGKDIDGNAIRPGTFAGRIAKVLEEAGLIVSIGVNNYYGSHNGGWQSFYLKASW